MKDIMFTVLVSLAVGLVTIGVTAFINTYKTKCITLGVGATTIVWIFVIFAIHSKDLKAEESENNLTVGEESVVMGKIPPNTKVGSGSVVIGATDEKGNTIINTPMAVGHNAHAGPNSIAIGANAGAGIYKEEQHRNKENK